MINIKYLDEIFHTSLGKSQFGIVMETGPRMEGDA